MPGFDPSEIINGLVNQARQSHDMQEMTIQSHFTELTNFISELSNDRLKFLMGTIMSCEDATTRGMIVGMIQGQFVYVRGLSFDGNPSVDSLLKEGAAQAEAPTSQDIARVVPPVGGDLSHLPPEIQEQVGFLDRLFLNEDKRAQEAGHDEHTRMCFFGNAPGFYEDPQIAAMDAEKVFQMHSEWDLYIDTPEDTEATLRCIGCNTQYVTLTDRMKRPKGIDGCAGCQQKCAQG